MDAGREPPQYSDDEPAKVPLTTRDDDGDDNAPPMISPARGPMDQTTPDVPTGSTPLTRHDD
jgi:hypothetical protein